METTTDLDTLKEKWLTGNHVIYALTGDNKTWIEVDQPDCDDMVLIHKKHAHIAEAVAKDSSVQVKKFVKFSMTLNEVEIVTSFFDNYDDSLTYELNNCSVPQPVVKQTSTPETISISDGDKVYEFVKPTFECELLKIVPESMYVVGYMYLENTIVTCQWKILNGECFTSHWDSRYNLTPVQKPWYEETKANALLIDGGNSFTVIDLPISKWEVDKWHYRLATKDEAMSLYVKGDNDE